VNDAERLCSDRAMRFGRPLGDYQLYRLGQPDGPLRDEMGLSRPENLVALSDLPGQWINKVHLQ
jgi:hypothetical protein